MSSTTKSGSQKVQKVLPQITNNRHIHNTIIDITKHGGENKSQVLNLSVNSILTTWNKTGFAKEEIRAGFKVITQN